MSALQHTSLFNRTDRVARTWYWAIRSSDLPQGAVRKVRMLGRDLVAWRGEDGRARIADAHCPHMGAHLGEGRVDGDTLRCFFHAWAFDGDGVLVDIPCQDHTPPVSLQTWPTRERYGLVWLWPGDTPTHEPPEIPELAGRPLRHGFGNAFTKACHPNVVMVNAIDEQHFDSVHDLVVDLHFRITEPAPHICTYDNTTPVPRDSLLTRALGHLYEGPLTYRMTYWAGTNGSVTVGPDAWHFHILFCLRPTDDGATEGQTILLSPRVPGIAGRLWNRIALRLTQAVGDHFAQGDTEVFESIRWNLKTPIKADRSILHFLRAVERQPRVSWGDWEALPAPQADSGPRRAEAR